jgi:hypothetical protein
VKISFGILMMLSWLEENAGIAFLFAGDMTQVIMDMVAAITVTAPFRADHVHTSEEKMPCSAISICASPDYNPPMKQWIPVVIAMILIMVSAGCVSSTTGQTSGPSIPQSVPATQGVSAAVPAAPAAACTSPYDGTYSGMVSGSGEHNREADDNSWTTSPYILSYSLEITTVCEIAPGEIPGNNHGFLRITRAKASDPFFGCTEGCTLGVSNNALDIAPPGQRDKNNYLELMFPNGASVLISPVFADSDAKTLRADQVEHDNLVAWSHLGFNDKAATDKDSWIENSVCTGKCMYPSQQGLTMTLNKIA